MLLILLRGSWAKVYARRFRIPALTYTFVGMTYLAFECSNTMSASKGDRKNRSVKSRHPRAKISTFSEIGKLE